MDRTFKIGTFNVHNLALPEKPFYSDDKPYSVSEYEQKIAWIGNQLRKMNADLVGFQEVFDAAALTEAVALSHMGRDVNVFTQSEESNSPMVALATRFPIVGTPEFIAKIPDDALLSFTSGPVPITEFSRPVLRARVRMDDIGDVVVYVVHLKSMRAELLPGEKQDDYMVRALGEARALTRRAVEAAGLRSLLLRDMRNSKTPVIAMGDFNGGTTAVTTAIVSGQPRRYDCVLYDAVELQSRQSLYDAYYTYIFNGHYESLDHIFLSEEFHVPNKNHVARVDYVRLFTDHLVDQNLCNDPVTRCESDHAQVVVTIAPRSSR